MDGWMCVRQELEVSVYRFRYEKHPLSAVIMSTSKGHAV